MQGLTNNKPDFRIQVKGLFETEEKRFEVVGGDKKRSAAKKKSDLGWIDRLDEEEPEDMESEAYEAWGDRHEALEDLADDIQDRLEEL